MARLAMPSQGDSDSDDLPSLEEMLLPRGKTAAATTMKQSQDPAGKRCSPRKKLSNQINNVIEPEDMGQLRPSASSDESTKYRQDKSPLKRESTKSSSSNRETPVSELETTSSTSTQQHRSQRPLKLTHVNSLLLPINNLQVKEEHDSGDENQHARSNLQLEATKTRENEGRRSPLRKAKQTPQTSYKGYQSDLDEEDEFTDLSGFIVDDDADSSFHAADSDSESFVRATITPPKAGRRLVRGRDLKKKEEEKDDRDVEDEMAEVVKRLDVVDLSTPPREQKDCLLSKTSTVEEEDYDIFTTRQRSSTPPDSQSTTQPSNIFTTSPDPILRFSPPRHRSPYKIPAKPLPSSSSNTDLPLPQNTTGFKTPPSSPSKPKLKSPSKPRAPQIPTSPHRPSLDSFWSAEIINEWNDSYSPQKAPLTSPRKKGLAKFMIHSDDEEDGSESESEGVGSSPTTSPRKRNNTTQPMEESVVSPSKLKKALLEEKKAAKLARDNFDATKQQLAASFLAALDERITSGKLASLSASTGGVKILWSNTLRSTAGRANWRRSVKTSPSTSTTEVLHFASIELSTKIITTKERLINTLAHEFCHLANFMVSNVKDQPHGANFKAWAAKVSKEFKDGYDGVERVVVTTKHDYVIDFKYLWVCAGEAGRQGSPEPNDGEASMRAGNENGGLMDKLQKALSQQEEGCGTEYGRHSKSIDVRKHRCGKCRGGLVQVRPKPRNMKKGDGVKGEKKRVGESKGGVEELVTEMRGVEISD